MSGAAQSLENRGVQPWPPVRSHLPRGYVPFVQTMRWFGPADPVSLADLRQAGCTGVVTSLHGLPPGAVWTETAIRERQALISAAGLSWDVVESLPVAEAIKLAEPGHEAFVDNWSESLRALGACGVRVVTYNFMPVLDWTRTDLDWEFRDGSRALRFDRTDLAVFDIHRLRRPGAEMAHPPEIREAAAKRFRERDEAALLTLERTLLAGLPGGAAGLGLDEFRDRLGRYAGTSASRLKANLARFLQRVVPVAEEAGVLLAIHPDDPPEPIFGLPRIVSTADDLAFLLEAAPSAANGLCFCTGSLGVRPDNPVPELARRFGDRVHFAHLRNTTRMPNGDFWEDDHLAGDTDLYAVVHALAAVMQRTGRSIPIRPDHGHRMLDDLRRETLPGYSAIGRLRGLAELRGLELGIARAHFGSGETQGG